MGRGGPTDRVFEGSKTIYMAGCSGNNLRVPLRQANPTGHRSMCMLPIFSLEYISMFNVYFHYDFPAIRFTQSIFKQILQDIQSKK